MQFSFISCFPVFFHTFPVSAAINCSEFILFPEKDCSSHHSALGLLSCINLSADISKKRYDFVRSRSGLFAGIIFIYLSGTIIPVFLCPPSAGYVILSDRIFIIGLFMYAACISVLNRNSIKNKFSRIYLISNIIIHLSLMLLFLSADINIIRVSPFFGNINIWITAFAVLIIMWCFAGIQFAVHLAGAPYLSLDKNAFSDLKEKYGVSEREIEIIMLLCRGLSYKEIAYDLSISYQTVKTHINNVCRKCSLNSRVQLLNYIMHQYPESGQNR